MTCWKPTWPGADDEGDLWPLGHREVEPDKQGAGLASAAALIFIVGLFVYALIGCAPLVVVEAVAVEVPAEALMLMAP